MIWGGIDLTKYRYKTVVGRTVQGKGFLLGFKVVTKEQITFTFSIDGIIIKNNCITFPTSNYSNYYYFLGSPLRSLTTDKGQQLTVNIGLEESLIYAEPMICPIPYRNSISLTADGVINVLEYVG